uniref:Putative secreted protein n=1 Tax=Anopheles darlingi TaxID=43151 RepID=A0A2M4DA55_ANODA
MVITGWWTTMLLLLVLMLLIVVVRTARGKTIRCYGRVFATQTHRRRGVEHIDTPCSTGCTTTVRWLLLLMLIRRIHLSTNLPWMTMAWWGRLYDGLDP